MDKEKEYKKLLLDNYKAISRIILTYNKLSNRFPTEFIPLMNELVSKSNDKEYAIKTYDLYKDILQETKDLLVLITNEAYEVIPKHLEINRVEIEQFQKENEELFEEM